MDRRLSDKEFREQNNKYDENFKKLSMEICSLKLCARKLKKKDELAELIEDAKMIETQNEDIVKMVQSRSFATLDEQKLEVKVHNEYLAPKLKRIELPKFGGNTAEFEKWRQIFKTCVDKTSLSPIDKQIQLESCLYGEAKRLIQSYDLSESSYKAAIEKLDRYYGGNQRNYASLMSEVMEFPKIGIHNIKDLDAFVTLMDSVVVRLKYLDRETELEGGLLYQSLVQKLPEVMVLTWERYREDKDKKRNVQDLKLWIEKEAELKRVAAEGVHGINALIPNKFRQGNSEKQIKNSFLPTKKKINLNK